MTDTTDKYLTLPEVVIICKRKKPQHNCSPRRKWLIKTKYGCIYRKYMINNSGLKPFAQFNTVRRLKKIVTGGQWLTTLSIPNTYTFYHRRKYWRRTISRNGNPRVYYISPAVDRKIRDYSADNLPF